MEILFDDLAIEIFNKAPRNTKELSISFDIYNFRELYEILLDFFVTGLKIKFGTSDNKVNIQLLSQEDFDLMNKYMNSFGIQAHFEIFPLIEFHSTYPNFIKYEDMNSNNLIYYKYNFNVDNIIYIIYFSFL